MDRHLPKGYRYCYVPECKNTSKNHPEKLFLSVPCGINTKKKWFIAANRIDKPSEKTNYYCCEDHFNLTEDVENYMRFSLIGGRVKIKNGVLPHKFACQSKHQHQFVVSNKNPLKNQTSSSKELSHFDLNKKKIIVPNIEISLSKVDIGIQTKLKPLTCEKAVQNNLLPSDLFFRIFTKNVTRVIKRKS